MRSTGVTMRDSTSAGLGARPGDRHVHHGDPDLRLFLPRSGEERERPEAQGCRDQQRGELAVEEGVGDAPGEADAHAQRSADRRAVAQPDGVEDDALAGFEAGADLGLPAGDGAGGDPAEARLAVRHHEDAREAAALEDGFARERAERGSAVADGQHESREEAGAQPRGRAQVGPHLEPVGGRDRPPGRSSAPRPDTGAGLSVHGRRSPRDPGFKEAASSASSVATQLEAAVPFDLDQGGARRYDVAHVDGHGRDAAGEGRAQDRVGQVVLGALPRRPGGGRARRRRPPARGGRGSLLEQRLGASLVRPPRPSARPRPPATADRSAAASRRTTTVPAATRSPSRWGTSTTEAETRAARAARCRARTMPGTAASPPSTADDGRGDDRARPAPSRLQRPRRPTSASPRDTPQEGRRQQRASARPDRRAGNPEPAVMAQGLDRIVCSSLDSRRAITWGRSAGWRSRPAVARSPPPTARSSAASAMAVAAAARSSRSSAARLAASVSSSSVRVARPAWRRSCSDAQRLAPVLRPARRRGPLLASGLGATVGGRGFEADLVRRGPRVLLGGAQLGLAPRPRAGPGSGRARSSARPTPTA